MYGKLTLSAAAIVAATGVAGCGGSASPAATPPTSAGGHSTAHPASPTTINPAAVAGAQLHALMIRPEVGYREDPSAGATGSITPAAFASVGGAPPAENRTFISGFRDNYVNTSTSEGLTITIMRFKTSADAAGYLKTTAGETLTAWDPKVQPFRSVPGAIEYGATKPYDGEWAYGVVMTRGPYYASVVYANVLQMTTLPVQFSQWATVQYVNLT